MLHIIYHWAITCNICTPPPCRGPHFPRGKLVLFSRGVIGKNGRKMLFPEGLKTKNALPDGVQVSFRGVNYADFFLHSRGVKIPKSRGPRQGGVWFFNVIAHLKTDQLQ